uniref:Arrestin_N domain-containing protein n=1 Tax=Macrostomum lignano TaxID=282301 RepID=A0A1I8HCX5_9PLAT
PAPCCRGFISQLRVATSNLLRRGLQLPNSKLSQLTESGAEEFRPVVALSTGRWPPACDRTASMVDYINKFDIELAKPVWYAGEELTGHIIVDSTENFKVRGIRVHLRGRGHVEWKVSRSGERHSVKEDQVYLDAKTTVWGIEKGLEPGGNDALPILPRGAHKWQFSFPLPESALPPSFESRTC